MITQTICNKYRRNEKSEENVEFTNQVWWVRTQQCYCKPHIGIASDNVE